MPQRCAKRTLIDTDELFRVVLQVPILNQQVITKNVFKNSIYKGKWSF